jgi:hypothetical protein
VLTAPQHSDRFYLRLQGLFTVAGTPFQEFIGLPYFLFAWDLKSAQSQQDAQPMQAQVKSIQLHRFRLMHGV